MGNTVLTYLRKIKHPVIQNRIKAVISGNCYAYWSTESSGFIVRMKNNSYEFELEFKHGQEKYHIYLNPTSFSMVRKCVDKFYDYTGYPMKTPKVVAELENIAYNDFEAMIFQHSLLGELGMFGVQEAKMLLQLRNIYFGVQD